MALLPSNVRLDTGAYPYSILGPTNGGGPEGNIMAIFTPRETKRYTVYFYVNDKEAPVSLGAFCVEEISTSELNKAKAKHKCFPEDGGFYQYGWELVAYKP
jgi:hypothetical protein